MTPAPKRAAARAAAAAPHAALAFAVLCWSGNFAVGRWASPDMPPVALSFWRHAAAAVLVAPFAAAALRRDWPAVRGRLPALALLAALFVAGNTLVYFSVLNTTVINAALVNAGTPVAAVFFSWLLLRDGIDRRQALGILSCFAGIAVVASRARPGALLALDPAWGDLHMLGAVACWALYMVLLPKAAAGLSPWTLLVALSAGGGVLLLPALAAEAALGAATSWSGPALGGLAYAALFSTVAAWACWNAGTLGIGASRASAFMCLHPLFGPLIGMTFFDEAPRPYHAVGAALVLAGIVLAARSRGRPAPCQDQRPRKPAATTSS